MPDGMTPENNIYNQFKIGAPTRLPANEASMQSANAFTQPESKARVPDIRMQKGPDDDDDRNKDMLEHMLRQQEMFGERGGHIREMFDALKLLNKVEKPEDKENQREKIAKGYENTLHTSLDEMNSLNKYLENFRNPYPYDSRYAIQFFDQALQQVNEGLRNKEEYPKEGIAMLKVLKRDFLWASSSARITEAMGPAFEMYFDGEMELSRLRSSHTEISSEEFMKTFDGEMYGCRLSTEEEGLVKNILKKRPNLEFKCKNEQGNTVEKIGLREAATEIQDRFGVLLYQMVGAGQKNLEIVDNQTTLNENPLSKEAGEYYANIDRVTHEFLSEVFNVESVFNPKDYMKYNADGALVISDVNAKNNSRERAHASLIYISKSGLKIPTKPALLDPFCMGSRSDEIGVRTYKARMQELIKNFDSHSDVLNKLRTEFEAGTLDEDTLLEKIKEEADKIFDITDKKIMEWENGDEVPPYDRLIDTVMRNMTNLEHGSLSAGDLGWHWEYEAVSPPETEKDDSSGVEREYVKVSGVLGGKLYKDTASAGDWDLFSKRILFKESKLGRDGRTFFVDDSGNETEIKAAKLTQGEWNRLSAADKLAKHDAHEYSPDEMDFLSSRIVAVETGNASIDTNRKQVSPEGVQWFVKRKSEMGSIYENHDVTTVAYLARHLIDYDNFADTRSTIFPPSIGWYRNLWADKPPYWRPEIKDIAPNDHRLLRSLGLEGDIGITSANNALEKVVGRKSYLAGVDNKPDQTYGRFDRKAAEFIKKNVWAFATPFLERPGDKTSDYLVLPVFIPTQIKDISFWRMVSLETPAGKVRDNPGKSIWHERLNGKKLSKFKWDNMDKNKFSWVTVTNDQMERWLGPLLTPHDFNRMTADEVKKHYMMPGGKAEKESGKRARLGGRGGMIPEGVLRATVFAQNKIISSMGFSEVLSTDPSTTINIDSNVNEWLNSWVAPWVNTFLDMPSNVRGCSNYGGTAAQSAVVTYQQIEKIVRSVLKTGELQQANVVKSLAVDVKNLW